MIKINLCSNCGDIIEEGKECSHHPDDQFITYESKDEAFAGEALMEYIYGGDLDDRDTLCN